MPISRGAVIGIGVGLGTIAMASYTLDQMNSHSSFEYDDFEAERQREADRQIYIKRMANAIADVDASLRKLKCAIKESKASKAFIDMANKVLTEGEERKQIIVQEYQANPYSDLSAKLKSVAEALTSASVLVKSPDRTKIIELKQKAKLVEEPGCSANKFFGALLALVGVAIVALAFVGVPFTSGGSAIAFGVAGGMQTLAGMGLFYNREKSFAKILADLVTTADVETSPKNKK